MSLSGAKNHHARSGPASTTISSVAGSPGVVTSAGSGIVVAEPAATVACRVAVARISPDRLRRVTVASTGHEDRPSLTAIRAGAPGAVKISPSVSVAGSGPPGARG